MLRYIGIIVFVIHMLMPIAVSAQEKGKGPTDISLKTYGMILGFALLGGLVSWYNKVRKGEIPSWGVNYLVGELSTAAFAGLICFWVCTWAGFPEMLTAALTGVFGHMGSAGVAVFEKWAASKFGVDIAPSATLRAPLIPVVHVPAAPLPPVDQDEPRGRGR